MVTAVAQPVAMTIQPELFPLVRWSTTLATTPSPRTIRSAVPKNSARMGDIRVRAEVGVKSVGRRRGALVPCPSVAFGFELRDAGSVQFQLMSAVSRCQIISMDHP